MRALMLAALLLPVVAEDRVGPHLEAVPWSAVPAVDPGAVEDLREALGRSLDWIRTPGADRAFQTWPGLRDRVARSLQALQDLLDRGLEGAAFQEALSAAFTPYRLRGADGSGTLHLTGYCEAWAEGSRHRSATYCFPLYRRPKDFAAWKHPHPTRLDLEGRAGTGGARLKGQELVWLKDRFDAYLFHVQGSGRISLAEGGELRLGFGGRTEHPFVAVGDLVVKDLQAAGQPPPSQGPYAWLRADPERMARFLPRNPRFVFFAPAPEGPPKGAFGMGVTADRTFAADSRCIPPGAPALLSGSFGTRLAFHQDRGGAILGPGRLDIYAGGGPEALSRSSAINGPGEAFVLLVKE